MKKTTQDQAILLAQRLLRDPSLINKTSLSEIDDATAALYPGIARRILWHARKLKEQGGEIVDWGETDMEGFPD